MITNRPNQYTEAANSFLDRQNHFVTLIGNIVNILYIKEIGVGDAV